jgi:hypothetical protein
MRSITGGRPAADEYASFFAGYVERVPDGDILTILQAQLDATHALLAPLSRAQALARPTPEERRPRRASFFSSAARGCAAMRQVIFRCWYHSG